MIRLWIGSIFYQFNIRDINGQGIRRVGISTACPEAFPNGGCRCQAVIDTYLGDRFTLD
jgi:hypothetical protein